MPIYAARWPDFTLSLVEADNQRQMLSYLDEIAEPTAVNFKRLEKPLFLTLKVDHKDDDAKDEEVVNTEDKFDLGMALVEDHEFCDVTFIINDTKVKCHKAVLASRCSYFNELFKQSPSNDTFCLEDTLLDVFLAVKKYIYTNRVDWKTSKLENKFLFDMLKYTKTIDGLNKLTEKVVACIKNRVYSMKPKDLVYGYCVTEDLAGYGDLNVELKKKLMKLMREEKDKNEDTIARVITNIDRTVYEKLLSEINKESLQEDKLKDFHDILRNFKGKNFVSKVTEFIDEKFDSDEDFKVSYNPYFELVSRCVRESNTQLKKQCIRLINLLSKYKFDIDKKERSLEGERTPLHLASLNGALDVVKALVNVGADVLLNVRPNGQTLLHVLDEMITESKSDLGQVIAILNRNHTQVHNTAVFDWLMSHKGYNDISQVPHHEGTNKLTIGSEYVRKLMCGFVVSEASVPFVVNEVEGDTDREFREELNEMMHPRVSELASQYDEMSYPEDDTELKKGVTNATKRDVLEATRVFHPDPKCRKMADKADDSDDELDDMDMNDSDLISTLLRQLPR